jgi:hypothetical protein
MTNQIATDTSIPVDSAKTHANQTLPFMQSFYLVFNKTHT